MILRFKDSAGECVNIFFDRENYNFIPEAGKQYITVSAEDLARISSEINFNCYSYETDLYRTEEQKENDLKEYQEKEMEERPPF